MPETKAQWTQKEIEDLKLATKMLEDPGILIQVANLIGAPVDRLIQRLPSRAQLAIQKATKKAITTGLDFVLKTIPDQPSAPSNELLHKIAVTTTGGLGGLGGLITLPFELPVSTMIMLRSIAEIARSEGEHIQTPESKLECLSVLALGGTSTSDDSADTGYFATRLALSATIKETAAHLAEKGLSAKGAPVVMRFIGAIASRFGVQVSEKAVAQAAPVIGALGGASINLVFMTHFQAIARGHFIMRRLERTHGFEDTKSAYYQR